MSAPSIAQAARNLLDAADDLLIAAKAVDTMWSNDGSSPDDPHWSDDMAAAWRGLRAAIAKAEGRA
ncbi:hypothetical protein [Sphingomonas sp. KC8]|uniref:hypothetical protein n=1 Tax=Sphingomonas sp. KC8 TaxID=1030157 RepID=UPI0002489395|nr:hypothetical protein [Sphingomonas sp. KC8]ARS29052.1 hypothetical protein KC8_17420 [Sphingomonas sp. KC8]